MKPPNVDQKIPHTVAEMVNILTDSEAVAAFDAATALLVNQEADIFRVEGFPSSVYDYAKSPVMVQQLKGAKRRTCHIKAPGIMGHIVNPGALSFYIVDGKIYAVSQGRWMLTSYKASWVAKNIPLVQADLVIGQQQQVLIIRVPPGAVGRIHDQGVEILLDVGTHVFNSGTVENASTVRYASSHHISHGRYHFIRVPRGKCGRVWAEVTDHNNVKSLQPRLLAEGEHYIDSHLFRFDGLSDVSDEYIKHGSIHRIAVERGNVAKVVHDNWPRLLGAGDHLVESPQFVFKGMENVMAHLCILHGTISIVRVTRGMIALVWKDNEPTFLDQPGIYEFDSPDFSFVEFKSTEEQLIELGARKIVLVHTGQVGVTYDQGQLKILKNGRHEINNSTHVFHRFLSTQQRSIRLSTMHASEKMARNSNIGKDKSRGSKTKVPGVSAKTSAANAFDVFDRDSDLTICETKDLVKVGMRADVFYSIEDPEKCIQKIDTDELEDLVRETAVATLTNIVRSTALNQIAQSTHVSAGGKNREVEVIPPPGAIDNPPPSAPMAVFFDKLHDEFISKLNEDFMDRYGVDIANIRIESFKIMDQELSEQISKHALTTAKIENDLANLEGQSLISTTQERTAAEVMNINAEADATAQKTKADAENQRKIDAALATAESHKIAARAKAEAESEAILARAKAEAEAVRLKAAAEAERAEVLSRTTLGQQESLLAQYAHMVIESNKGVEKVIYLDPSVNRESPFALGSLQNLNNDLHSLSKLGIAANGSGNGKH